MNFVLGILEDTPRKWDHRAKTCEVPTLMLYHNFTSFLWSNDLTIAVQEEKVKGRIECKGNYFPPHIKLHILMSYTYGDVFWNLPVPWERSSLEEIDPVLGTRHSERKWHSDMTNTKSRKFRQTMGIMGIKPV